MYFIKDYLFFSVLDTVTIRSCLQILQTRGLRTVLCVNSQGLLSGTFSLGDFSRWIMESEAHSIDDCVIKACNTSPLFIMMRDS